MEKTKLITGFENYCIDNSGNVFSLKTGIWLKPWKIEGYFAVGLYKDGIKHVFLVHRLVAIAFIPNPENKPQVDHKNGVLTDNRQSNLRWATPSENSNNPVTIEKLKRVLKQNPHPSCVRLKQIALDGTLIKVFQSFAEAKESGYLRKGIIKNIKGQTDNYNGYIWKLY